MAGQLTLRVLTPEKVLTDTVVDSLQIPGVDGLIGILPRHAHMVAALEPGLLSYRAGGMEVELFVSGGFAEVRENTVRVLTGSGEKVEEIDLQRAREAESRARELLAARGDTARRDEIDFIRAETALRKALMRIQLSDRTGR